MKNALRFACCLGLWTAVAAAAEMDDFAQLGLADCRQLAQDNSRQLARRYSELARAVLQREIAETEVFLPTLTAGMSSSDERDAADARVELDYDGIGGLRLAPFLDFEHLSDSTETRSTAIGITISKQLLRTAERVRQRLPITRADKDILAARNRLSIELRRVDLEVIQAFYGVQRAAARLGVRRTRVADSEAFLEITRRRVERGFAAPVDEVNAEINLNQAQADLISEESAVDSALDRLKDVLGLELEVPLSLQQVALDQNISWDGDPEADTARLLSGHEDLVNERLELDLQAQEIAVQQDRTRPDLDLSLTAQHQADGDTFFAGRNENAEEYRIAVSYTTTLDFKKSARARLAQLRRERTERESRVKDTEIRLLRELRDVTRTIERSQTQIGLNRTRLDAERAKLDATAARYERGNVDNLEVTRAKQSVDSAAIQLLESQIALILAIAQYRSLLPR